MADQKYSNQPYIRDSYKSYVLGTAVLQAALASLPGGTIGFVVYVGLVVNVTSPQVWLKLPQQWWWWCLIFAGLTGGLWGMWVGYIESFKWDTHNRKEQESTPSPVTLPDLPPVEVPQPQIECSFWVENDGGRVIPYLADGSRAVVKMEVHEATRFQAFLTAVSLGAETSITREHVTKRYRVKRAHWEKWRDVMASEKLARFDGHSTPVLTHEIGQQACGIMAVHFMEKH